MAGDVVKTGGMDRANYALASYLLNRGDELHLAAHHVSADLLSKPNAVFHAVPKPLNSYLLASPLLGYCGSRLGSRIHRRGGRVIVNGGNCRFGDVNWVHYLNARYQPVTSGGWSLQLRRGLAWRLYTHEERVALKKARLIITTGERNKADLIGFMGTPPERVHSIYYGADPEVFHPASVAERAALREKLGWPQDRPVLAFVGALGDMRKGFDTLFASWRILCAEPSWDGHLVVAGSGAELAWWRQRAAAAGLASRIDFLGFRRDVPDLMRASDVHVSPTRYEPYSLVTQEAICCGNPAFVSRVAGIAERYPAELQELLIPDPEDATDLASRLRHWRSHRESMARAVARFSEQLRAHTWDDMARKFISIVERTPD